MSSPTPSPVRNVRKRQADDDDEESNRRTQPSSPVLGSSPRALPPSSPAAVFGDIDDIDEDDIQVHDEVSDLNPSDEEEGEDLMDNLERDYMRKDTEDHYDLGDNIDDEEYDAMDAATRRRIDEQLNRRDNLLNVNSRSRRQAFLDYDDEDDQEDAGQLDQYGLPVQRRRRRHYDDEEDRMFDEDGDDIEIDPLNEELSLESLTDIKAPSITEWVTQPAVQRSISRELKSFLLEYTDEKGRSVYGARIRTLGEVNAESLEVSYDHLADSKAILALFLATSPAEILSIFDIVAMEATELHYPNYSQIHSEIHVRITNFPKMLNLRDLRENNLNQLVKVSGVVTRRTGVFPQLKYVKFDCLKCGIVLGPYVQDSNTEVRIQYCSNCQSKGPFKMNSEKTLYRNYQRITLQEAPGTVPAGRLPRHREVILLSDLVDVAKPGEAIEVTGVYKNNYDGNLNVKNGFPVFATIIEANSINKKESSNNASLYTEEEEREFRNLSKERGIIDKIISSVAPSIYGHKDIKTAIACSLFGGVAKDVNGKHSIRGDINVLLLGDPGTAKSQFLKYAEKSANRAVFATGQGASAVGLTASVRKDPITREWTLEGGALVLADKGTCLIDEFDKMNDQDRTSIHEAMEQQSISISKAGIVTTLQARCAIIAAANPNGGRYNSTLPLAANVDLTEPILSRFDILCVVRDLVNPESDERLASFVIDSHMRSHPSNAEELEDDIVADEDMNDDVDHPRTRHEKIDQLNKQKESEISPIAQELLVKYINYARTKVHPKLHQMDMDKVARVYAELRKESLASGSFPITVRHLESILRIAEAFAKMRLSDFVSQGDLNRAIKVSIDSFVGTQKVSVRKQLQAKFQKFTLPTRVR